MSPHRIARFGARPRTAGRGAWPLLAFAATLAACAQGGNDAPDGHGGDIPGLQGAPASGAGAQSLATAGSAGIASAAPASGTPTAGGAAAAGAAPVAGGSPEAGASAPIDVGGAAGVGGSVPAAGEPTAGTAGDGQAGDPQGAGGPPIASGGDCAGATIAPVSGDYSAMGPFPTQTVNNTGPDGQYTIVRPTTLGANGFKHPIVTWGNGITTNPTFYPQLLGTIASHGFVVIASNSSSVTAELMSAGLDWMVMQNSAAGEYQDKLNPTCLATVGYSLGGGAAVGSGAHENVVVTVSMHGVAGTSALLHAPLLLLTSENDAVCVPSVMVTPTFEQSAVQTFYGTMSTAGDTSNLGHLIPVDGGLSLISAPAANLAERAATIAWLRLWVYGDEGAKKYFYGDDCILCQAPWAAPQRKNWQ